MDKLCPVRRESRLKEQPTKTCNTQAEKMHCTDVKVFHYCGTQGTGRHRGRM